MIRRAGELPRPIVDRLHGEVVLLLKLPDVREKLAATGSDPLGSTPEAFAAQIIRAARRNGATWEEIRAAIKRAGVYSGATALRSATRHANEVYREEKARK